MISLLNYLFNVNFAISYQASLDDLSVFLSFSSPPKAELKSLSRWYNHIAALLSHSFPGPATGVKLNANANKNKENNNSNKKGGENKKDKKKEEKKKEEEKPKKAEPTVCLSLLLINQFYQYEASSMMLVVWLRDP